jgi:hypothetical protein
MLRQHARGKHLESSLPSLPEGLGWDSSASLVDSSLWHEDCDEVSVGAEVLFRSFSVKSERRGDQQGERMQSGGAIAFRGESLGLAASVSQSSSGSSVGNNVLSHWPEPGNNDHSDISSNSVSYA